MASKMAALRASLARQTMEDPEIHARVPLGHGEADACLQGGLRRGALHEILAEGSHEAAGACFAAALSFRLAADKPVLWIRQDFSAAEYGELAATGLLELGLDPARLLVLRLADAEEVLRAGWDALSCRALGAVVIEVQGEPRILDLKASRRLTLASARKGVTAFLLRFKAESRAGTAETRGRIRAASSHDKGEDWGFPAFEAELVRNRQGRTGHWVMEWSCDDGLFREPHGTSAEDSGAMVSPPFHRPAASSMESPGGAGAGRRIA